MAVEERLRAAGVKVEGTFDVQRFFGTLARILSARENMNITVKVLPNEGGNETEEKEVKQNVTDRSTLKERRGSCENNAQTGHDIYGPDLEGSKRTENTIRKESGRKEKGL